MTEWGGGGTGGREEAGGVHVAAMMDSITPLNFSTPSLWHMPPNSRVYKVVHVNAHMPPGMSLHIASSSVSLSEVIVSMCRAQLPKEGEIVW